MSYFNPSVIRKWFPTRMIDLVACQASVEEVAFLDVESVVEWYGRVPSDVGLIVRFLVESPEIKDTDWKLAGEVAISMFEVCRPRRCLKLGRALKTRPTIICFAFTLALKIAFWSTSRGVMQQRRPKTRDEKQPISHVVE